MKNRVRIIVAVLVFGLTAGLFAGCSGKQVEVKEAPVACSTLLQQLCEAADGMAFDKTVHYDEKDYSTYFEYWYDMPMRFVSDGAIAYVGDGNNADEISILYPESSVTYDTVKKALERRIDRQKKHFTGLIDEQAKRMESDSGVYESGGYLMYLVAENPDSIVEAFYAATKEP